MRRGFLSSTSTPFSSGLSVLTSISTLVPSTARMSPPGSSTFGSRPLHLRVFVSQLDVFDVRHLDDLNVEVVAAHAVGGDVVSERLAHVGEQKLKARALDLALHGRFFPLHAVLEFREQLGGAGLEADHLGGDGEVGALPHGGAAGLDDDLIERFRRPASASRPRAARCRSPSSRGRSCPARSGRRRRPAPAPA